MRMMIWLRKEYCSPAFHQCNQKMMAIQPTWGDDDIIARSMMKDDDDMTTWWHDNMLFIMKDHDFMMTWWQTWLEGKTRWPLVDWGAVRDSVLEGDRCCAKRYLASSKNLKYLYISRYFKFRENMAVKQKFHWLCIFTSCECILMYAFPYSRGRFL